MMRASAREGWRLQWRVLGGSVLLLSGDACPDSRAKLGQYENDGHAKRKKRKG